MENDEFKAKSGRPASGCPVFLMAVAASSACFVSMACWWAVRVGVAELEVSNSFADAVSTRFGRGTDEVGFGSVMKTIEEVEVAELGQEMEENEARTQGERMHAL